MDACHEYGSLCAFQFIRVWKFKHHMTNHSILCYRHVFVVCLMVWVWVCYSNVCMQRPLLPCICIIYAGITHPTRKRSVKCPTMHLYITYNVRFSSVNWALHRNHKFIEINLITSIRSLGFLSLQVQGCAIYLYGKYILYGLNIIIQVLSASTLLIQQCTTAHCTHTHCFRNIQVDCVCSTNFIQLPSTIII